MLPFLGGLEKARATREAASERREQQRVAFARTNLGASARDAHLYELDELRAIQAVPPPGAAEPHSGLRLVKRYLEVAALDELLDGVRAFGIGRFLSVVTPPEFRAPKERDYAVLGIAARRAAIIKLEASGAAAASKRTFVALTLCDLQYEILVEAHGKRLEALTRIKPGTMVALLNPEIVRRPGPPATFVLRISADASALLEVGRALDFGQCVGTTKAQTRCKNWVNTRRSEVCDWHLQQSTYKAISSRPEFNSTFIKLHTPKHRDEELAVRQGGRVKWLEGLHVDTQSDLGAGEQRGGIYRGFGRDESRFDKSVGDRRDKESRRKRKAAELENESRIRRKLAARRSGFMLRQFDDKGFLAPEEAQKDIRELEKASAENKAFTAESIRRMGFDPVREAMRGLMKVPAQLKNVHVTQTHEHVADDDDDLEIV